jgi:hypothetical protein
LRLAARSGCHPLQRDVLPERFELGDEALGCAFWVAFAK